ncbi:hypothetical protein niasHS_009724 [Heterodera schachtii]|uniref:Uncharacterized protein n=1 Tax=Heterodera schachtii TaxID=97005 RepID=A0ABD2J390_HETSC
MFRKALRLLLLGEQFSSFHSQKLFGNTRKHGDTLSNVCLFNILQQKTNKHRVNWSNRFLSTSLAHVVIGQFSAANEPLGSKWTGLKQKINNKTLEKQPATYAVRKTEIKSCFISEGRFEIDYNVFSATIPRRMTIALVANGAFNGNYSLSPFNFKPFDIRDIAVYAGGMIYPIVPYKLDFAKDIFVRPFVDMYEALSMANSERSFDITKEQFKSGWTFFVIPLTSTLDDSTGYELLRSGTTSIRATL